jgi:hypothetical protein
VLHILILLLCYPFPTPGSTADWEIYKRTTVDVYACHRLSPLCTPDHPPNLTFQQYVSTQVRELCRPPRQLLLMVCFRSGAFLTSVASHIPRGTTPLLYSYRSKEAGRTENSRIAQPILPNPSASSVRVPESRLSSSRTSRIARQPSKSFSPVASGSGTSHAPTMTQAQPPIDAERSSFVGSAQTGVSNPESGDITVFISPDLIRGSSVASGALGGVGGQLETGSAQRPGEN